MKNVVRKAFKPSPASTGLLIDVLTIVLKQGRGGGGEEEEELWKVEQCLSERD